MNKLFMFAINTYFITIIINNNKKNIIIIITLYSIIIIFLNLHVFFHILFSPSIYTVYLYFMY